MPVYFFDTSALVKRYINETGSAWIDGLTNPTTGNDVYILRLTEVEVTSAVTRRRRAGTLSVTNAATVLAQFRQDLATQYYVIDITASLLTTAVFLVETYGLRAYDAVQLATATTLNAHREVLSLTSLTFVSADQELNAAAMAQNLPVDDPNLHV